LFRPGLQAPVALPAGLFRNPEHPVSGVLVAILGVRPRGGEEFLAVLLEGVGDGLEEDEAEDDVLVLGGFHVPAELVRSLPELLLEAESGTVPVLLLSFASHFLPFNSPDILPRHDPGWEVSRSAGPSLRTQRPGRCRGRTGQACRFLQGTW